uniref:Very-long-chain (3R)-3-hydroxyacyl-CoA dehydratase n=1 Tax=Sporobolomyces primogenomicus TaxID=2877795 RepID=V9LTL9_9BASI|nr:3-hydroxyacyl-CoA dehydratase [Sporobolomyces primogenomicus]
MSAASRVSSSSSPSSPGASSARPRAKKSSPIKTTYLVSYNLVSALAWTYVLSLVVKHLIGQDGFTGLKEYLGVQGTIETLGERANTAFDQFGDQVKWVQTAAILEAVHSATRLVRSPLGTTVAQIASRLLIVWYVCVVFPQVPQTPFYVSMVTAWSFAEIIRYLHYATNLMNIKVPILEWIRYTAFYVLYPVGAGSEATLIYFSATHARQKFGPLGYFATIGLTLFWPPALAFMMSHMHVQRRKHLRKARASVASSPSTAIASKENEDKSTPVKSIAPKDITSKLVPDAIIEGTASATPARSTRSRSKITSSH